MVALLIAVIAVLAFEVVVWRFGADSRDGNDWAQPEPARGCAVASHRLPTVP